MTSPRTTAHGYILRNIPSGPLWPLRVDGSCSCPLLAACTKAGKHPLIDSNLGLLHGTDDYSTDPALVDARWVAYPKAGIGWDLGRAELLDIAPDSMLYDIEFQQRGLPPTATFRSSHKPGHVHYIYRRPEGCPKTKINRSGEFDIMAIGNDAVPATLDDDAPRAWLTPLPDDLADLPEAPAWAVAMLVEAEEGRKRKAAHGASAADAGDAPPVRLDADDMAVWRGERPKYRDGKLDRSGSLVHVARVLMENNAADHTIVAALAQCDIATGWRKYSDRKDAEAQYAAIVAFLHSEGGPRGRAEGILDDDPPPADQGLIEVLTKERDRERAGRLRALRIARTATHERNDYRHRCTYLETLHQHMLDAMASDNAPAGERLALVSFALDVQSAVGRDGYRQGDPIRVAMGEPSPPDPKAGETEREARQRDHAERKAGYSLAARAGVTPKTVSRMIDRCTTMGLIDRHTSEPKIRDGKWRRDVHIFLRPENVKQAGLVILRDFTAYEPPVEAPADPAPAPKPDVKRCPKHPDAEQVIVRTCAECGDEIHTARYRPPRAGRCRVLRWGRLRRIGQKVRLEDEEPQSDKKSDTRAGPPPGGHRAENARWWSGMQPPEEELHKHGYYADAAAGGGA
jgi:hypothetical protein